MPGSPQRCQQYSCQSPCDDDFNLECTRNRRQQSIPCCPSDILPDSEDPVAQKFLAVKLTSRVSSRSILHQRHPGNGSMYHITRSYTLHAELLQIKEDGVF